MSTLAVQAGELRHRISLQVPQDGSDGQGGAVRSWATAMTVWALIEPVSARELWQVQEVQARITHQIRIRYQHGITATMRVLYGSRTFNIRAVLNAEERNIYLDLLAEEGTLQ